MEKATVLPWLFCVWSSIEIDRIFEIDRILNTKKRPAIAIGPSL
jgi:hypothetical protein